MTIAILVPVLGRSQQIKPLLESIHATTGVEHRVIFVCSPGDEATKVCKKTGEETVVVPWEPGRADFARKINLVFPRVSEPWVFQGATDLKFHPQWAERALHVAEASRIGVVGTNDLGNPSVVRGKHSTHILFSRDYIERFGGTYDNTGIVFSEEYDHQFVDTEFIQTAILRRQFQPCLRSVVEHLHPHWGKGEMDDTYVKSEREFREDAKIFNNRMRQARRFAKQRPLAR